MYNDFPQQNQPYYQQGYYAPQQAQYPRYIQPEAGLRTPAPVMPQNYLKGRPVVSIDEARASQIDLDGSLYVFPDLNNKRIYTKQINLDGTATFNVFELVSAPTEEPVSYVTKEELAVILEQFKMSLSPSNAPVAQQSQPKITF